MTSRVRAHAARDVFARPLLQVEPKLLVDFLLGNSLFIPPFLDRASVLENRGFAHSLFLSRGVATNTQAVVRMVP